MLLLIRQHVPVACCILMTNSQPSHKYKKCTIYYYHYYFRYHGSVGIVIVAPIAGIVRDDFLLFCPADLLSCWYYVLYWQWKQWDGVHTGDMIERQSVCDGCCVADKAPGIERRRQESRRRRRMRQDRDRGTGWSTVTSCSGHSCGQVRIDVRAFWNSMSTT